MAYRLTDNDKWRDTWFNSLTPHAKLLFIYLYEKCDDAGFFEINRKFLMFDLGMEEKELADAIVQLKKCYIKSNDNIRIWLKQFLKHQKKLPLKNNVNSHKKIIKIIKDNLSDEKKFMGNDLLMFVLPDEKNQIELEDEKKEQEKKPRKRRAKPKFIKPTVKEIQDYMIEKDFPNSEYEANSFFNYNESTGWLVGKKPMINWKNAVNTWIMKRNKLFKKPNVEQVVNYMRSMDFMAAEVEGKKFFNWFESNGWKVGKNPMVNWESSANSWMSNWYERNKVANKSSKVEALKESHNLLKEVNWNEVYKD